MYKLINAHNVLPVRIRQYYIKLHYAMHDDAYL